MKMYNERWKRLLRAFSSVVLDDNMNRMRFLFFSCIGIHGWKLPELLLKNMMHTVNYTLGIMIC